MPMDMEHLRIQGSARPERMYSPDILPQLQSLLADLADIDFTCEKNLERIRRSPTDEDHKHRLVAALLERHREQRAPYVEELTALQERMRAGFE
ncbi:hypothetical protein [Microvirga sp. TS319]|uniref:hypothetical protein n=1 Tax=Microvirga sp. TS319 TaxID=3241165 RepID=UPI00351A6BAB